MLAKWRKGKRWEKLTKHGVKNVKLLRLLFSTCEFTRACSGCGIAPLILHVPFTGQPVCRGGCWQPWGCITALALLWVRGDCLSQGQGCQLTPSHDDVSKPSLAWWIGGTLRTHCHHLLVQHIYSISLLSSQKCLVASSRKIVISTVWKAGFLWATSYNWVLSGTMIIQLIFCPAHPCSRRKLVASSTGGLTWFIAVIGVFSCPAGCAYFWLAF